ncbi:MAG TPA: hypothetical protein VEA69_19460 [Tepidisphaeraceae bacterium]|nr:hypothetical protein [Tepidisphaeraceae bacterium]
MTPKALVEWLVRRPAWQTHAAGSALLVLIGVLAYVLQLGPLVNQDRRRAGLEADVTAGTARSRRLAADVKRTHDQAATAERFVKDAKLALRPRAVLNERLAAINELAAACGLQADGIEPGAEVPGLKYTTVAVRLTARGSAAQATRFLAALRERMPDNPAVGVEMTVSPSAGAAEPVGPCVFDLLWFTSGNATASAN